MATRTIQLQDEIVEKAVEIRRGLAEQSAKVQALEESVRKGTQNTEAVLRAIDARKNG